MRWARAGSKPPTTRSDRWRSSNGCAARWSRWRAGVSMEISQAATSRVISNGQSTGRQSARQSGRQSGGRESEPVAIKVRSASAAGRSAGRTDSPETRTAGASGAISYYNGRFAPEGIYEPSDPRGFDPQRAIQAATRELNDMRQMFKDNPDLTRQLADVEREISRLAVGDISSAELQNRLNREVLPNLESLEVQLRRQVEQQNGDQVRSGSTDKVPAGYADAVAEYFRKLSKGKP